MTNSGKRFDLKVNESENRKTKLQKDKNIACMLYRDAPNKIDQIHILSELYLEPENEVAKFLFENGYDDKYIQSKLK